MTLKNICAILSVIIFVILIGNIVNSFLYHEVPNTKSLLALSGLSITSVILMYAGIGKTKSKHPTNEIKLVGGIIAAYATIVLIWGGVIDSIANSFR